MQTRCPRLAKLFRIIEANEENRSAEVTNLTNMLVSQRYSGESPAWKQEKQAMTPEKLIRY